MKIEVSNGELLDRFSILEIKLLRIDDQQKLLHVRHEHDMLKDMAMPLIDANRSLYLELRSINEALWEIEDRIRVLERDQSFGEEFIQTARSVYRNNDKRAAIKREINKASDSSLFEEKSYQSYEV